MRSPGVVAIMTRAELEARGWDQRALRRGLAEGRLIRLSRGMYSDGALSEDERHLALRGPADVLALESAALVHGLPVRSLPARVQVAVDGPGRSFIRGMRHLHSGRYATCDVTSVSGVPATTLARTLVDLARLRSPGSAVIPWESALWHARVGSGEEELRQELAACVGRLRGMKGVGAARRLAAWASSRSESPMESLSRIAIRDLGLPTPEQQVSVVDERGQPLGVADFGWRDRGVLGEYDGVDKYERLARPGESPRDVMLREKRRQRDIELQGWVFARWEARDVWAPDRLRAIILAAFEVAAGRRAA